MTQSDRLRNLVLVLYSLALMAKVKKNFISIVHCNGST